jgi:N-acetylneuraminate lyase
MKPGNGIYTALLTPFAGNRINESALRALIDMNISKGVSGFYVCGSTGEAFLQTPEKRQEILEIVADHVNGRASIIAHIGAIGTDLTVELGRHAIKVKGVDAVSSIPPFYYQFSEDEIVSYYLDIAEQLDFKFIPYNFPKLSGVTLTPRIISRMRENKNIIGIKFTSNNFYDMERVSSGDEELLVYNGFDEMFLAGLTMGANGAIGSTFNYIPEKYVGILNHYIKGELEKAKLLQREANDILEGMLKCNCFMAAQKYMVSLQGIPFGDPRKPFRVLRDDEKEFLKKIAIKHGII